MELYLPWNDTWIDIGTLPQTPDDVGNVRQITDAHIMTFQTGGVITLNVVGADIMDWNTGVEAVSAHVWKLMFSHVNHTHFWDSRDVDLMGKCDVQGSSSLLAMLVTILMSGH